MRVNRHALRATRASSGMAKQWRFAGEGSCARDSCIRLWGGAVALSESAPSSDRGPLQANAPVQFTPAKLATATTAVSSIAESLRFGSAGAVSSALPWVDLPPSEQCANSWAPGLALSMVGCVITRNRCGVQDSGASQMDGFWGSFSCKCGGERGLDSKSSSSLLHRSCWPRFAGCQ